jgi:hypothetical protein
MSTVGLLKKLLNQFPDDLPLQVYAEDEYVDFDPTWSHWYHDVDYGKDDKPLTLFIGSNVNYELDPVYHLDLSK